MLATLGHPFGKEAHERGMSAPLSHGVVCGDQETGRSSRETEPKEPTESQSSRVRRCCASQREGTVIVFYHIYTYTQITKHSILKDIMRDRQTSWATLLFREEDASSWEEQRA